VGRIVNSLPMESSWGVGCSRFAVGYGDNVENRACLRMNDEKQNSESEVPAECIVLPANYSNLMRLTC
jgi:hypothetical protein